MRVVLTTMATRTHLYSMVPLGWALKAAGHEVRVVVQPSMVTHVTEAGLAAVPVGKDIALEMPTPSRSDLRPFGNIDFRDFISDTVETIELIGMLTIMVPTFLSRVNEGLIDGLVGFARSWHPDLVVWEPMTWSGALAARACGARHARLQWGPDVLGATMVRLDKRMAELPEAHREDPLREWFMWTADRVGVEACSGDIYGEWTIEVEPPPFRLQSELETMEVGYVPYNGPAVWPEWLEDLLDGAAESTQDPPERPRVCVTLGVSSRDGSSNDAVNLVELARGLGSFDATFVVTMNPDQAAAFGTPPSNVRVVDYVALDLLLPFCAAIVHHGGAGTWSTALRHGVPQVILGHTWDAPLKAGWIDDFGAGLSLSPESSTGQVLAGLGEVLEEPTFRARALELSTLAQNMPTPAQAVRELEARVAALANGRG